MIANYTLINVSDTDRYENPRTKMPIGLEQPLRFECGVHSEITVEGWKTRTSKR